MEQEQLGRVNSTRMIVAIGTVSAVIVAAVFLLVQPADAITLCNDGKLTQKVKRPCAGHGGIAVRDFAPVKPGKTMADGCPEGTKPSSINLCIFDEWTEERVATSDTCWLKVSGVRDLVQVECRKGQP